jgi:uncharacterized protein with GYD domain
MRALAFALPKVTLSVPDLAFCWLPIGPTPKLPGRNAAASIGSRGGYTMSAYVMLATWTDQGLKSVNDVPKRIDAARRLLEEMGGQFQSLHMTMGAYDLVGIYDAPDDAIAARFMLLLSQQGMIRTMSMKAFAEPAFRAIINSLR